MQTWIRGVAEVAYRDRWCHWRSLRRHGSGIGISLGDADEIARSARPIDVLEYADAVHQEIVAWLGERSESDLDQILDIRQRLAAFPEYQTPGFVEEIANLYDQPIWSLLMRPCIGHVHGHLGELEVVKHILRATTSLARPLLRACDHATPPHQSTSQISHLVDTPGSDKLLS